MKKSILSIVALAMTAQVAIAQSRDVSGQVLDDKGLPAIGASVTTSDKKVATFTDAEGNFTLTIPSGSSSTILIDNLGVVKSINTSGKNNLGKIVIDGAAKQLDGVVVTGYRNVSKEKYNGAADRIDAKTIEKFPVSDVTKAIEGAAPGIQVTSGTGDPGSGAAVRVRGFGSISASSAPLYVVDGTPYAGDITAINPSDIQSLNILKDAVATSMYGSRGANGVIVITTKRGTGLSAPVLSVDAKTGIVMRGIPDYDIMKDPGEYMEKSWEAYKNNLRYIQELTEEEAKKGASGELAGAGIKDMVDQLGGYNPYNTTPDKLVDPNTGKMYPNLTKRWDDDWTKELIKPGSRSDVSMSLAGRSDKSDYYMSLGYLKEEGFVYKTDYQRFTSRLNLNNKVNNWLSLGLNLSGTYSTNNNLGADQDANTGNPMFITRDWAPVFPFYYYDSAGNRQIDPFTGEYKWDWGTKSGADANMAASSIGDRIQVPGDHVYGSRFLDVSKNRSLNVVIVPRLTINFTKDLSFNTLLNYNIYDNIRVSTRNKIYGLQAGAGGSAFRSNLKRNTYTFRQQLNYRKTFNELHNLDVLAVHENYDRASNYLAASRTGLPYIGSTNLAGATTARDSYSEDNLHRIESYLFSAQYDYDGLYGIEGSVRRDGSSRFSPDNRWGTFFGIGGSVNLKRMDFLKDVSEINKLRLKTSYGTQGNEAFGNYYAYQSLYDIGTPNGPNTAFDPSGLGNEQLTWEKSKQFNVGLEYAIFNNRVSGEVSFFRKGVDDMLFNLPIPASTGFATIPTNALSMYNQGIEATISADVVKTKNVLWNATLNLTSIKNRITKMSPQQDSIKTGTKLLTLGTSIYDFWLVESAGVYNYESLAGDSNPDSAKLGRELYYAYDSLGNKFATDTYSVALASGRKILGSAIPTLQGSLNNQFSFGNVDFGFLTTFALGGKYYDAIYARMMHAGKWGDNWHRDIMNSWSPENSSSTIPRVQTGESKNTAQQSSRFLIDGSYLNIRNITLGYTLPSRWTEKINLSNVRVYALADNVALFSKRKGMNPQDSFNGVSSFNYVAARTIMFGVKFNLK